MAPAPRPARRSRRLFAGAALAAACSGVACEAGTGGRFVTFDLHVRTEEPTAGHRASFVTATGWSVTLEEACIALGPVYLYESDGLLAGGPASTVRRSVRWLADRVVPAAHAHAGHEHFAGGTALGEWLEQRPVDLLAPDPLSVRGLTGIAGSAGSFSVHLDPPRGRAASDACLRGHHAYVRGVATRGGESVPFAGGLDLEEQGGLRRVEGLPLGVALDDGAHLVVRVRLAAWLDQAHFETLPAPAGGGERVLAAQSQPRQAWFLGARSPQAFRATREEVAP